jgi:carbamoyl-phosphate synthase small subunit
MMNAVYALEDGTIFRGTSFGATGTTCGEAVFNTSMTGYQEILTDPSYKGQIVAMTYPEIGNYGINDGDMESWRPHAAGFVVRQLSSIKSNWRSQTTLDQYLKDNKIPGIQGVDTRALTKKLRVKGAMKACLSTENLSDKEAVDRAKSWKGIVGVDYVKEVTHKEAFDWDPQDQQSRRWQILRNEDGSMSYGDQLPPADIPIVAYDFGIKYNILRRLRQRGFKIHVVPATTSPEAVMKLKPRGVFLSNGPGDPEAVDYGYKAVKSLIGHLPIFGICLGHQILGLALGGRTFKLKFGHRGGNQPVKDLRSEKVAITSQNHGFAVDHQSLNPNEVEVSHINLNDQTVEGLRHKKHPIFSVQYHPEASPGPHDAAYLFDEFRQMILKN